MLRLLLLPLALLVTGGASASDFAGPNQFICGTATTMEADPLGAGESGFWTLIQGSANFGNSVSPTSLVTGLSFGENILQWTLVTPNGATPDQVSIFCYDSAMPDANAGPDQVVLAPPGTAQMDASPPIAPAVCFWTLIAGQGTITNPNDPNTTVTNLGIGPNVLQWSCDNGPCGVTSDVITLEATQFIGIAEANYPVNLPRYNPATHQIIFDRPNAALSISVLDGQGRELDQGMLPPNTATWDLSALPPGIYLVQIRAGDEAAVLRFVVDH